MALSWRLKVACLPGYKDYESLLEAWYTERKQQLELSLAATIENGKYVTEGDPLKRLARNTYLWLIQLVPTWKRSLEQGARREGMLRYVFEPGMHFLPDYGGGQTMPQVYAAPICFDGSCLPKEGIIFTDDQVFSPSKSGPFQLVALVERLEDIKEYGRELEDVDEFAHNLVIAGEVTYIVADIDACGVSDLPSSSTKLKMAALRSVIRIATADEFASSHLCRGRPEPLYYNPYRIHQSFPGKKFLVVRPDRIVFAACRDKAELIDALRQIEPVLKLEMEC